MQESWIIVRDNKPELSGWLPERKTRHVKDDIERRIYLHLKMQEEEKEIIEAHQRGTREEVVEECADLCEVWLSLQMSWLGICFLYYPELSAICDHHSITSEEILHKAQEKRATHGSFDKGILLDLNTVTQ